MNIAEIEGNKDCRRGTNLRFSVVVRWRGGISCVWYVKALLPILSCGGAVRTAEAYLNGGEATKHFAVAILQFYMRRAISFQIIAINNWCVWNMGL